MRFDREKLESWILIAQTLTAGATAGAVIGGSVAGVPGAKVGAGCGLLAAGIVLYSARQDDDEADAFLWMPEPL